MSLLQKQFNTWFQNIKYRKRVMIKVIEKDASRKRVLNRAILRNWRDFAKMKLQLRRKSEALLAYNTQKKAKKGVHRWLTFIKEVRAMYFLCSVLEKRAFLRPNFNRFVFNTQRALVNDVGIYRAMLNWRARKIMARWRHLALIKKLVKQ